MILKCKDARISEKYLYLHIHCHILHYSKKVEGRCPRREKEINKMWHTKSVQRSPDM